METNQMNTILNGTGRKFSEQDETSFEKNLESEMNLFQESFQNDLQYSLNKRISFAKGKEFYYFQNDNNLGFEKNMKTNRGGSKQRQGPNSSKQIKRALLISTKKILSKEGSDLNKAFKNTISSEISKINQQEKIKTTNQKKKNSHTNTSQVNGLEFDERLKITKNLLQVLDDNLLSQKISKVLLKQLKSEIPQLLKNSCQQNIIKIMNQTIPIVFQQIQKKLNTELNNKFILSKQNLNKQKNINSKEIQDTIIPFLDKRTNIINESIQKIKKRLQIQIATSIQEKKPFIIQKLKNEI
ncbi:hypothetical protein M0813_03915 [Anaeramoeba flamelloides]|uniref:Uncharacterized protein n=1 Tax=Anaeramoeba flamelloides TaxID=1746091 RepID=A0ABQ8XRP2_9EUKA|nr:hypothetical protein M0813_03915 [Anaeramoeba flamelloides]